MGSLRIAVRKFGPFENAVAECITSFKRSYPSISKIEFVAMDLEELYEELFVKDGLRNGNWDLAHINTDWIAQAQHTDSLEPLHERMLKNPVEGEAQPWSASLMQLQNFEGEVYGLPFHDGPECLVYRKDLFEDPLHKEQYLARYGKALCPPTTWDDFLNIARFFNRPDQNLYGSVFAGYPDGHNAVFDFCIQLWARGGSLVNTIGEIDLRQNQAVQALDFYRSLYQEQGIIHPKSKDYESIAAGEAFARGEVAMMINWFGFASWAHIDKQSAVRGAVDIATIPSGISGASASLNVYWIYALAAGSTQKDLAYEFMRFAAGAQNDKKLTLAGGVGCRFSTWSDPEILKLIPFYAKLPALHEGAQTLPRNTMWPQIAQQLDTMVNSAIQTDLSSANLLAQAQEKINKLS